MPPRKACAPMRANWMTAAPPPRMAKSPTVQVAGQHDVVGEDDVVADVAVVADVRVGEERAAVADHGRHAAALGAGVHGHALADQAVAADRQRRRLALVLEVLRLMADRGERKDARARRRSWCGRRRPRGSPARRPRRARRRCRPRSRGRCFTSEPSRAPPRRWPSGGPLTMLRAIIGIQDHGADLGLGHDLAVDLGLAVEAPGAAAAADLLAHGSGAGRPAAPACGTWRGRCP